MILLEELNDQIGLPRLSAFDPKRTGGNWNILVTIKYGKVCASSELSTEIL